MPGRDRRGPVGAGPMTGRGLGYCNTGHTAGYIGDGFGRSYGFGRGLGVRRGRFGGWRYTPSYRASVHAGIPTDQVDELRVQADELRTALAEIERRLSETEME